MNGLKSKSIFFNFMHKLPVLLCLIICFSLISLVHNTQSVEQCSSSSICRVSPIRLTYQCGGGKAAVPTSIDFGCSDKGNPIDDLLFAIIRFLSDGVGLVVIASVIIGGIQYIVSRGDPNATQAAIKRLTSALIALLVFIFAYAILNYVIPPGPGGFFK